MSTPVVAGSAFNIEHVVYLLDGTGLFNTGTIIVRIFNESTNKYWSADGGGAWEAEGDITTWPTATSRGHGMYAYQAAAGVTTGLSEDATIVAWMDDNDTPGSATGASAREKFHIQGSSIANVDDISDDRVLGED